MNNFKKKVLLICLFLFVPTSLTGCWDANEPERMFYVHGLGIDHKKGKYELYVKLINPSLLAKAEVAGGTSGSKVIVGRSTGKTLSEAIFNIYNSSQRRIFWGHLAFFVFSESALKKGAMKATIDLFDRYRETRYNTWMYATNEPIFQLLTTLPPLEMSTALSRLSDPFPAYNQSSVIRPIDLRELLIAFNEPPYSATIPYVELTKKHTWQTDIDATKTIKLGGVYSITRNTLKDRLTTEEIRGLMWMNEKLVRAEVSLKEDLSDVSLLVDKIKVKIKPIINEKDITFQISIDANTVLREIIDNTKLKKIEKEAENLLKSQIKETFLEGLKKDVDIYRLSEIVYRKDYDTWKAVEQNGNIPLSEQSLEKISVSVKIKKGDKQRKLPTLQ